MRVPTASPLRFLDVAPTCCRHTAARWSFHLCAQQPGGSSANLHSDRFVIRRPNRCGGNTFKAAKRFRGNADRRTGRLVFRSPLRLSSPSGPVPANPAPASSSPRPAVAGLRSGCRWPAPALGRPGRPAAALTRRCAARCPGRSGAAAAGSASPRSAATPPASWSRPCSSPR